MVWKKLGKEGIAVQAPWPEAGEVDKILARQAKFLRDSVKQFRASIGKVKASFSKVSILVSDQYPEWKVKTLTWMQEKYDPVGGFEPTFMKELKTWAGANMEKKMIKFTMQFASFVKKEAEEVGAAALEVQLPFDQKSILEVSIAYIKAQINVAELDVIKLWEAGTPDNVPPKMVENVTPGKPSLWCQ